MYSVNGVPLDNPSLGWILRAPTKPLSTLSYERASLASGGRDGVVAGLPATTGPVSLRFVVQSARANLETLIAVFGAGGTLALTASSGRQVEFETLSHTPEGFGPADAVVDATFLIRLPGAFWRDITQSTKTSPLAAASVAVSVFGGISAPVADAVIRVQGAATAIQVTDSSGAWVVLPNVAAGQWARFDSASGKAFVTTSDTWSGGTDVSGQVDFGGPRGVFEITPALTPGNPTLRFGQLTVTTASRNGASVDVRGKAAYVL
ncbi:hypothetical protein QE375_001939 [Microbacterium foliorum]|uniref:Uncharacterized protein n=1 Tax=Microbacterium foliorum TaxID=104336 RepID=A0ABU1HQQ9_9MICO|nr:hypothetical protein [Microbacterium foliorum]MDR6142385.1 hypothetical protein [Microbacterium foliorum]